VRPLGLGTGMSGSNPISPLSRLENRLKDIFGGLVDLSDVEGRAETDREQAFRTRALAALSIMELSGASPKEAAASICDGFDDDGIDAVFASPRNKKVYFVQSKWFARPDTGFSIGDFTRFRDGVKRLLNWTWDDQNKNLHRFEKEIEVVLQDIDAEVVLVLASSSDQPLSEHIQREYRSFVSEQIAAGNDWFVLEMVGFRRASQIARTFAMPSDITIDVLIRNFGQIISPFRAVYGQVAGSDIADWVERHGTKMYAENLRYHLDESRVNENIVLTASKSPDLFWYYNNGITVICSDYDKRPFGGTTTESGMFSVRNASIINGAQTAGSLAKAKQAGATLDNVNVHVRFISIRDTPEDFSKSITRANNTQNSISALDFVAADDNQERIRREAQRMGLLYSFRRGDPEPSTKHGFSIREAAVAAACAHGDLRLAVMSKRYVTGLWEDTSKEPYTLLFTSQVTADYLWAAVQTMRHVDNHIESMKRNLTGKDKLIATHGNRFLLYEVFVAAKKRIGVPSSSTLKNTLKIGGEICDKILPETIGWIKKTLPDAYPGNVFKNQDRQRELLTYLDSLSLLPPLP
jgi:AIPR protein